MKTIYDFIPIIKPKEIIGNTKHQIFSITDNSKICEKYSMFFAIKGNNFDGHNFIDDAIGKGSIAIVCEYLPEKITENVSYLIVENTKIAFALASHFWFDFPTEEITVVGVTGTNGKTTITHLLNSFAEEQNIESGIIGTLGAKARNFFKELKNTTPSAFELAKIFSTFKKSNIKFVAMEVSSHSLDQFRIDGINFAGAIFTNLTQDHLDYHQTMENYLLSKQRLFNLLHPDSIAVINGDDPASTRIIQNCPAKKIVRVGRNKENDVLINGENYDFDGISFELTSKDESISRRNWKFFAPILGRFNIENSALAIVMALSLGFELPKIQSALQKFSGVAGRMEKVPLANGAIGIVDYSHTPDALQKALETCREILRNQNNNGKLICVFGCGGNRDTEKRPIMGKIASLLADYVVITSDNPRDENPDKIIRQIYKGIDNEGKKKVILITNRDEAIDYAYSISGEGDIILVAGKGHENYQIIGNEKFPFSDKLELEKFGKKQ